jgi:hypothetical protein
MHISRKKYIFPTFPRQFCVLCYVQSWNLSEVFRSWKLRSQQTAVRFVSSDEATCVVTFKLRSVITAVTSHKLILINFLFFCTTWLCRFSHHQIHFMITLVCIYLAMLLWYKKYKNVIKIIKIIILDDDFYNFYKALWYSYISYWYG